MKQLIIIRNSQQKIFNTIIILKYNNLPTYIKKYIVIGNTKYSLCVNIKKI
jgi:hypothetical protein